LDALVKDMEVGILGKKQRIILFGSQSVDMGPELNSKLRLFHQRIVDGGYDSLLAEHFPHQAYHKTSSGKKFYENIAKGLGLLKDDIADCTELYRSEFYQSIFLTEAARFLDLPKIASECTLAGMEQSVLAPGIRRMSAADSMEVLASAAEGEDEEEEADDPDPPDDCENAPEGAGMGPSKESNKQGTKRKLSKPSMPVAPVGLGIKVGTQVFAGDSTTEEVSKRIAAATKIHQAAEYKLRFTDKNEEDRGEWAFDSVPDCHTTLTEQVRHLNSKNPEGCANRYVHGN